MLLKEDYEVAYTCQAIGELGQKLGSRILKSLPYSSRFKRLYRMYGVKPETKVVKEKATRKDVVKVILSWKRKDIISAFDESTDIVLLVCIMRAGIHIPANIIREKIKFFTIWKNTIHFYKQFFLQLKKMNRFVKTVEGLGF